MNTDKQTLQMKVHKVVRKKLMNGPDLLDFHLSVLSYHPKERMVKEHKVPYPSVCTTVNHLLPTSDGLKEAEKVRPGDILLCELPLLTRPSDIKSISTPKRGE